MTLWSRLRSAGRALFGRPEPARAYAVPVARPVGGYDAGRGDLLRWASHTVEKVRAAAQGGRLRFLPFYDPYTQETPEIRLEYRRMLREPTLKAALGTKVLSVTQQPVQFHPEDADDPRQRQAADFAAYAFKSIRGGTAKAGWSILSGLLIDGHCVCEKVWKDPVEAEGKYGLKRIWRDLKSKDTHYLWLGVDPYRNVVAVRGGAFNAGHVWDPADFVVASYLPLFEHPSGMSDFRAAYRAYWVKDTCWKLRALHLDKYTGPYLKGTYASYEQKLALEEALEQARASTWVTVPEGALVEAIELSTASTAEFQSAIQDCDREMLIGTVGAYLQILEGQVSDARGDTSIHKETSELFQWLLSQQLATIYREQMLVELYELNYPGVPVCDVSLGAVSDQALEASARIDKALQEIGVKLSRKERQSYYGRAEPEDDEDILRPEPPEPPEPPGGGPGGNGGGPGGGPGGGGPGGGNPLAGLFAEKADRPAPAEATAVEDAPEGTAPLLADILYGLFGDDAFRLLAQSNVDEPEEARQFVDRPGSVLRRFAGKWSALDHPRGKGGRFIPKGSPEAVDAAKEAIAQVVRGEGGHTPEQAERVLEHLSILTVEQLRDLHREHGQKPPGRLRQQLVDGVKARLEAGKKPAAVATAAPEVSAVPERPAAGMDLSIQKVDREKTWYQSGVGYQVAGKTFDTRKEAAQHVATLKATAGDARQRAEQLRDFASEIDRDWKKRTDVAYQRQAADAREHADRLDVVASAAEGAGTVEELGAARDALDKLKGSLPGKGSPGQKAADELVDGITARLEAGKQPAEKAAPEALAPGEGKGGVQILDSVKGLVGVNGKPVDVKPDRKVDPKIRAVVEDAHRDLTAALHPDLKDALANAKVVFSSKLEGAAGKRVLLQDGTSLVVINPRHFDLVGLAEGDFADATPAGLVRHELGHALEDALPHEQLMALGVYGLDPVSEYARQSQSYRERFAEFVTHITKPGFDPASLPPEAQEAARKLLARLEAGKKPAEKAAPEAPAAPQPYTMPSEKWLEQNRNRHLIHADPAVREQAKAEYEQAVADRDRTLDALDDQGFSRNRYPFTTKDGKRVQGGAGWTRRNPDTGKPETFTNAEAVTWLNQNPPPAAAGAIAPPAAPAAVPAAAPAPAPAPAKPAPSLKPRLGRPGGGERSHEGNVPPAAAPAAAPHPAADPVGFAGAVKDAAAALPDWSGRREGVGESFSTHKPQIAAVYDHLAGQGKLGGMTLEEFKGHLVDLHRAGHVVLARNDLAASAPDQALRARSETPHAGAVFDVVSLPGDEAGRRSRGR